MEGQDLKRKQAHGKGGRHENTVRASGVEVFGTYDGHKLTPKENMFINEYLKGNTAVDAARLAGYAEKNIVWTSSRLYNKPYIAAEIKHRMEAMRDETIADEKEILRTLTKILRREGKDAMGFDISIADQLTATKELAKRIIDAPAREAMKQNRDGELVVRLIRGDSKDADTLPSVAPINITIESKDGE